MRIALTVWNDRISPVFDTAGQLLVVDIDDNGREVERRIESVAPGPWPARVARLVGFEPDVVLCGAISRAPAEALEADGVSVVAFLTGPVDEVLDAWRSGRLGEARFALPGCGGGQRRRRRRRGRCCAPGRPTPFEEELSP